MQTWRESLLESSLNVLSGFIVSLLVWIYIVQPLFNIHVDREENLYVIMIFTVSSLIRAFLWRRLFNWIDARREQ